MKPKNLVLLLIAVFLLVAFLFSLVYNLFLIKEVKVVVADFNVSTNPGLVGDVDALHFGGVTSPGTSYRDVHIEGGEDAFVLIKVKGSISEFLFIDGEPQFFITKGEKKTVHFELRVPEDVSLGKKTGAVYFYFLDPVLKPFVIS